MKIERYCLVNIITRLVNYFLTSKKLIIIKSKSKNYSLDFMKLTKTLLKQL